MKKNNLKHLAELTAKEKTISKKTGDFILKSLNRKNVKIFLHFYRNELQKKRTYVTTASVLSSESLKSLKNLFKEKIIVSNIDSNVGAGIKVRQEDIIIDYTFKRYIDDTIELLK